jgi:NhaP-type Na+/H+ or K+/H+ antiporter
MGVAGWFIVIGLLLVSMGLLSSVVERLPLNSALIYLLIGIALGPAGFDLVALDPRQRARVLEHGCEAVLLISLFAVGLKLRRPLRDPAWAVSLRLAVPAMLLTIAAVAMFGVGVLGLSVGAALLLGAILAPTDPVLASDVQARTADERDRLRFCLSAEGGLNDGTAFPFVLLALGLLGAHELGDHGLHWLLRDVLWSIGAGLGSGWLWGVSFSRAIPRLRSWSRHSFDVVEFLLLGLIALSYGFALLISASGFLAVFAAAVAIRSVERRASGGKPLAVAPTDRPGTHAAVAETLLGFNQQLERLAEFVAVMLVGIMLSGGAWSGEAFGLAAVLFLVVRPVAVYASVWGRGVRPTPRWVMGWFGIRGVGSLYYVFYSVNHGIGFMLSERLLPLVLSTVAISIVAHGVSSTPLMRGYDRWLRRHGRPREGVSPQLPR